MDYNKMIQRPVFYLDAKKSPEMAIRLEDFTRNMYLSGITGSGKTSLMAMMILSLLNAEGLSHEEKVGMFVAIYKESDVRMYEELCYRSGRIEDMVVISDKSDYVLNPMDYYAKDDVLNIVDLLSSLAEMNVKSVQRNQSEAFWQQSLEKRLDRLIRLGRMCEENLTIELLAMLDESQPSTPEQLIDNTEFANSNFYMQKMTQALKNGLQNSRDFHLVQQYNEEMAWLADNTASSIRAMSSSLLNLFQSSQVLRRLFSGKSNLDLEELCRGKVVILDLSIQRLKKVGQLAQGMLLYMFRDYMERRDVTRSPNVMIFNLDEFWAYQKDRNWYHYLSVCRSARSGVILASQSNMGLVAALGGGLEAQAKIDSILNLTSMKWLLSQNEVKSCEYNSQLIGKEFIDISSTSVGQNNSEARATINKQLHFRVMPHHFASELRTGGAAHDFWVDCYLVATGRKFSNGRHATKVSFRQWFADEG